MGLLDDLNDVEKIKGTPVSRCGYCNLVSTLTPEERDKLNGLMKDPTVTKARIAQVLNSNGHNVSRGTLYRHNRGECYGSAR
jgi:hypothetical protein